MVIKPHTLDNEPITPTTFPSQSLHSLDQAVCQSFSLHLTCQSLHAILNYKLTDKPNNKEMENEFGNFLILGLKKRSLFPIT